MKNDMIQIRHKPRLAHRKEPNRAPETVVISFQFLFTYSKDGIVPVTEKLNNEPKNQHRQQNPFPGWLKEMAGNQPDAIEAKHNKLGALDSHSFDQQVLADAVCRCAAQEPYPKCGLHQYRNHCNFVVDHVIRRVAWR